MKYDFTTTVDRSKTNAFKTNRAMVKDFLGLPYYDDSISMWVADMDFVCAPEIVTAIMQRASIPSFGYEGFNPAYYQSFIRWHERRLQMKIETDWVVYSNGTLLALRHAIRAFSQQGQGIIIQPPVYFPFSNIPKAAKRQVVENHLIKDEQNQYHIDFDDFEQKCANPNNKIFIFCNPHNPIGKIWRKEEVQRLMDICLAHDVIFFSDEVHADLLRHGQDYFSALNTPNQEKVIVATAANKTFNLAGLHITNLIIPNAQLRNAFKDYTGMSLISPLAQAAAIAAYEQCEDWLEELLTVLDDNFEYMHAFLQEHLPRVRFTPSEGTYLAWLDFNAYGIPESELLKICAEEAHLILEGGSMFGPQAQCFIRMNVACPKSVLTDALQRLQKAFENR